MRPECVLQALVAAVTFGHVAHAAYILPGRFPRLPDDRLLKRLLGVSEGTTGPGNVLEKTTSLAPNQSQLPLTANSQPSAAATTAVPNAQTSAAIRQMATTISQLQPPPQSVANPNTQESDTPPTPSPSPSPSPLPLPSPSPSPVPVPVLSPSLQPSSPQQSPSPLTSIPSPSSPPSANPSLSSKSPELTPSPTPSPSPSPLPSPPPSAATNQLTAPPDTLSSPQATPTSPSSQSVVVLTSTFVVATTASNGSPTSYTVISTTTTTPGLTNPSYTDATGLTPQTRNTVIGVVVGVGGAIVLGVLLFVTWRIWSRRRAEMNATCADYDPAIDKPDNIGPSAPSSAQSAARSPFQTTLENYHNPSQVNPSANF